LQEDLEAFHGIKKEENMTKSFETLHNLIDGKKHILQWAIAAWGKDAQIAMFGEEAAEASVEVFHHLRGRHCTDELQEECADLFIMIHQMIMLNLVDPAIVSAKLNRLEQRLIDHAEKEKT
jgi:hypothetical protein